MSALRVVAVIVYFCLIFIDGIGVAKKRTRRQKAFEAIALRVPARLVNIEEHYKTKHNKHNHISTHHKYYVAVYSYVLGGYCYQGKFRSATASVPQELLLWYDPARPDKSYREPSELFDTWSNYARIIISVVLFTILLGIVIQLTFLLEG